jgi:Adenosine deaminase
MNPIRLTGVPLDHVVAELVAYPLASEAAFRLGICRLDPDLNGATGELWSRFEREELPRLRGFSLDEAFAFRDRTWFTDSRGVENLHTYLRRQAPDFLRSTGSVAVPRTFGTNSAEEPPSEQDGMIGARRRWRWLMFALPPDLMLAALGENGPTSVSTLSEELASWLRDSGFAETHLHLGAALEFSDLWAAVMHRLAGADFTRGMFASPAATFNDGRQLASWLVRAAMARYVLAGFLSRGMREDFSKYLKEIVYPRVAARLGAAYVSLLRNALCDLLAGVLREDDERRFSSLRWLYACLTGLDRVSLPSRLEEVPYLDPIVLLMGFRRGNPVSPELQFLRSALGRLENGHTDTKFTLLFWQVVRLRCLFYRHVVQRPLTPGLLWFIRFFDRLRPARGALNEPLRIESAHRVAGHGHGLRSLEIRTTPDESHYDILSLVQSCRTVAAAINSKRREPCEIGLVMHFIKERCPGGVRAIPRAFGRTSHADPNWRAAIRPFRFATYFLSQQKRALALAAALRAEPTALQIIRGLDVASEEQGVPNWVILPLFLQVRAAAEEASRRYGRGNGPSLMLRTTLHAGEDFLHPLTGIRCVAECLHFFDLREGDRIGHALALGWDVQTWTRLAGRIAMSREDRLFDLAWEWDWRSRKGAAGGGRQMLLEREIGRLGRAIFGYPVSLGDLLRFRHALYSWATLRRVGFPDRGPSTLSNPENAVPLLRDYLVSDGIFRRGRAIEWIDPSGEGDSLAELQDGVRKEVDHRGITIEVNPSSNLLIGDISDLAVHPLWRLCPPVPRDGLSPVKICIGSDDPITFSTSLREEYQLVHDALVSGGVSSDEVFRWLEQARVNGLRSRFTLGSYSW